MVGVAKAQEITGRRQGSYSGPGSARQVTLHLSARGHAPSQCNRSRSLSVQQSPPPPPSTRARYTTTPLPFAAPHRLLQGRRAAESPGGGTPANGRVPGRRPGGTPANGRVPGAAHLRSVVVIYSPNDGVRSPLARRRKVAIGGQFLRPDSRECSNLVPQSSFGVRFF